MAERLEGVARLLVTHKGDVPMQTNKRIKTLTGEQMHIYIYTHAYMYICVDAYALVYAHNFACIHV